MAIFEVEVAEAELKELIGRARNGEEILIRDGENVVRLEPIFGIPAEEFSIV